MGIYATTSSLSELLPGSLVGETTTSDARGVSMFSRHIDRAESMVNAYVSSRYNLPFSEIPPAIRTVTEDIACYYFMRNSLTFDPKEKNPYLEEYKTAVEFLESVRDGETNLVATNGSLLATNIDDTLKSSTENYTPVFGLDSAQEWQRDSDEITDQRGKRL